MDTGCRLFYPEQDDMDSGCCKDYSLLWMIFSDWTKETGYEIQEYFSEDCSADGADR